MLKIDTETAKIVETDMNLSSVYRELEDIEDEVNDIKGEKATDFIKAELVEDVEELKTLYDLEVKPLPSTKENNVLKMRIKRLLFDLGINIPNEVIENEKYKEKLKSGKSKVVISGKINDSDTTEMHI